jgi:hypothetical protein
MPLPTNLTRALIHKHFTLPRDLQTGLGQGHDDLVEASRACSLVANGAVALQRGGRGLWIPYRQMKATYGMVTGYDWAVSGPFSGCELAVGRRGTDVFVAHIARESGRNEAIEAFEGWNASEILYRAQIRLNVGSYYGCYVFVSTTHGLEIVRMDVQTLNMGGTDGTILNIQSIDPTGTATAAAATSSRGSCCRCIVM